MEHHSYVRDILNVLAEREAEEDRVRRGGASAVDTRGLTSQELVLHLNLHGSRTVERLSRELQLEMRVTHDYVNALASEGLVALSRTGRGSTVVCLVG